MMKIKFKKRVVALVCAIGFSTLYSTSALAVWPVTEEILTPYLMGLSPTSAGNGIISTLVSMNDKLAQATITNNENEKNQVLNNANQAIQQQRMQNILKRTPSENACQEVTQAGGRGSASSNTSSAKDALSDTSLSTYSDARDSQIESKKNVYTRPTIGVCTEDDVKYSRGNCSSVGQYPDKDKSADSLTTPPLSTDDKNSKKVSNESFDAKQMQIAEAVKRNLVGNLPVEQINDKSLENSQEGREFLSALASFVARSTAGTNAIDSILAMKKASNVSINSRGANIGSSLTSTSDAATAWTDQTVRTKYQTLFPGADFPDNPSEWEMLRYEIYSRYADTSSSSSWQVKISSADEKDALREIARMQAIQLRLSMLQIQRQEDANIIAAAQLGSQLQPVNKELLINLKNNATRNNTSSQ